MKSNAILAWIAWISIMILTIAIFVHKEKPKPQLLNLAVMGSRLVVPDSVTIFYNISIRRDTTCGDR